MNTKLVVALFVGAISANQLPNINMLTVQTSDEGVRQITAQGQRVENAWNATVSTQEAQYAGLAGQAWANTTETQEFFGVLEKASHSQEAHRLHGHAQAVHDNVQEIHNGAHINNNVLESRLHAIELELDHIERETSFPQEVGQAWQNATSTHEAQEFHHSLDSWSRTHQFQNFHHELERTEKVLDQYVAVSDLPASW